MHPGLGTGVEEYSRFFEERFQRLFRSRYPIGGPVGMYHPAVREKLRYRWSARDSRLHRALGRVINVIIRFVPFERRYHPRTRAGWQRVHGKISGDAPLVETPARNLPPLAERGNPKHYAREVSDR